MGLRKGIFVLAIIVAVLVVGCSSETSTKQAQQTQSTPAPPPNPTPTPTLTPLPTSTPTPTPTLAPKGSLENPADPSETLVVKTLSGTLEITVLEYIRGAQATQKILQANMFNERPPTGYEYLLVKVRVKYAKGESSIKEGAASFKVFVDGEGFDPKIIVWPSGMKDMALIKDLLPGGQTEGWIAFIVPKGKEALLSYDYLMKPVGFIKIPSH